MIRKEKQENRRIVLEIISTNLSNRVTKKQIKSKLEKVKEIKQEKGITLMVLVITIIVLLILAGITISSITGNNGIIGNAGQAREEAEIANEKEILEKATVQAMGNNKYGNIEERELQEQLDRETGEEKTVATDVGEEVQVLFKESKRYYLVDKNGKIEGEYLVIEDEHPGNITVGIDGKELAGNTTEPYEIWCIEDLCAFSKSVNEGNDYYGNNVKLMTTLNFNSSLSYSDSQNTYRYDEITNAYIVDETSEKTLKELITDENGVGFIPIGKSSSDTGARFRGTFDGDDNEIKNIYVNTTNNAGLFGGVFLATVENIKITGTITSSENSAGGLIGDGAATIKNCTNEAKITANRMAGGIVGTGGWQSKLLENCCNIGDVYSESYLTGGMAGSFAGTINNCYNLGNIESSNYTAGILGQSAGKVEITNCFNQGAVKAKSYSAGGIIAYEYEEAIVNNCYNTGIITIGSSGISGACSKGIGGTYINNCYNIGKVEPKGNCYAIGDKTINNCYYDSTIVGSVQDANNIQDISNLDKNEFVNLLNSYTNKEGQYPSEWKIWKMGANGYPTFE